MKEKKSLETDCRKFLHKNTKDGLQLVYCYLISKDKQGKGFLISRASNGIPIQELLTDISLEKRLIEDAILNLSNLPHNPYLQGK